MRAMMEIPAIYFQQDFNLSNPDTFAAACPDDRDVSSMSMAGRCRSTLSLPVLKARLVSALDTKMW